MNDKARDLLPRKRAAAYLGVQAQTLALWAHRKRPRLPYTRLGGRVAYDKADLDKFISENRIGGSDERG